MSHSIQIVEHNIEDIGIVRAQSMLFRGGADVKSPNIYYRLCSQWVLKPTVETSIFKLVVGDILLEMPESTS